LSGLADGEPASDIFIPVGPAPEAAHAPRRGLRAVSRADEVKCAAIPTETPKYFNHYYMLETEQADEIGISYAGTAKADIQKRMKLFVREYSRYDTCPSTDGKAELQYGAVWRATVLIDQSDIAGNMSFAVVAASATLKNLSVQVSITHEGFDEADRVGIDQASQAAMEATKDGLNVTSFVKFNEAVENAIGVVTKAKVRTPLRLIGVRRQGTAQLLDSVARTVALAHIAKGHELARAVAAFPAGSEHIRNVIEETYQTIAGDLSPADKMVRLAAQRLIEGVKVPLGWFE